MRIKLFFITISLFIFTFTLSADDASYAGLLQISPKVWVHKSYMTINGYRTDSNGMVVNFPKGIILVDTCWNDLQTHTLLKKIKDTLHKPVLLAIITHAHEDRIGGIGALLQNKIKVISTPLTKQKAIAAGYTAPQAEIVKNETTLTYNGYSIEVYYPGAGHSEDNITVYIPSEEILFGGCLIKSAESKKLGNIADANVAEWSSSVQRLISKYPNLKIVIPGHGKWGGIELMKHTIKLCPEK